MDNRRDEKCGTPCATSQEEMKVRGKDKRKRKRSRSRSSSISSTSSASTTTTSSSCSSSRFSSSSSSRSSSSGRDSPKSKSKKRKKEKRNKKKRKKENKLKKKKEKKKKREKSGPVQLSKEFHMIIRYMGPSSNTQAKTLGAEFEQEYQASSCKVTVTVRLTQLAEALPFGLYRADVPKIPMPVKGHLLSPTGSMHSLACPAAQALPVPKGVLSLALNGQ
ncbi:hypothetical protein KIL84_017070 [Mauremys mutica]|uniref:Uncharacterized protein n=1 Tax=Mauremys mutica TaxID=74926 RepID=A0A9D3X5G4_9SAUR|nr:hypothetical protein KIL84_017070 [Mauremys mutica]